MNYWLIKSEPSVYSWENIEKDGESNWDGVRNFQANNYLKAMKKGDKCFFYHSNDDREIVGIVKVTREFYPDKKDKTGKFGMVDVALGKKLASPVSLAQIKNTPALAAMPLIKQSRLSVMPVKKPEWEEILALSSPSPACGGGPGWGREV